MARGGLLVFTDDDVEVEHNWIETYCDFFARMQDEIVLAGGPIVPVPDDLGDWPAWFDHRALWEVGLLDSEIRAVSGNMNGQVKAIGGDSIRQHRYALAALATFFFAGQSE